jgi:hypothetical protein
MGLLHATNICFTPDEKKLHAARFVRLDRIFFFRFLSLVSGESESIFFFSVRLDRGTNARRKWMRARVFPRYIAGSMRACVTAGWIFFFLFFLLSRGRAPRWTTHLVATYVFFGLLLLALRRLRSVFDLSSSLIFKTHPSVS